MTDPSHRYVALLRGINVGRNKRIAMPELRAALEAAGYGDVRTLLVSGNVVLTAETDDPRDVAAGVERVVLERFGHDVRVVVRTAAELAAVAAACPMPGPPDGSRFMIAFLAEPVGEDLPAPPADAIGDDRWWARPGEVYVWCPAGLIDSPAMAHLERVTKGVTHTTVRNWNTVAKLAALCG